MKTIIEDFELRISTPHIYIYETGAGYRINYYMDGTPHYLHLLNGSPEAAEILKKANLIHKFTHEENGNVAMYVTTSLPAIGPHGVPVIECREVKCLLSDFKFSHEDAIHLAAIHEYRKTCKQMGMTAQVINLFDRLRKAAA